MLDYIIIGAGSAGCVLAGRLSQDPQVQVALLEAGSTNDSAVIRCPSGIALMARTGQANWRFDTTPQAGLNGRTGYQPRGKGLGGCSAVNAMVYARGHRTDYDHWAALGNPGWGYDEVLPYFMRAENNARGADALHGGTGPLHVQDLREPHRFSRYFVQAAQAAGHLHNPDFNGEHQEGVGLYQVTQHGGERCSAAQAYLSPAVRQRTNLHIATDAHVWRILLEKKRAVGVEYAQGGEIKQLRCAREVLLCAGALQSPQILLLSGIGDHTQLLENGIATQHHLPGVGLHLHDHPDVVLVHEAPKARDLLGISPSGLWNLGRAAWTWRTQRRGLLTSNLAEAGGFIKSRGSEPIPDLQLHFVIGKLIDHGRTSVLGHGYSCHVCLLRPKSRGSVKLVSKDPFAAPLIDPNFLAERDDLQRLLRGFKLMRYILAQAPLSLHGQESAASEQAQSDLEIEHFIREHADTVYHPVGSCRMGPGPLDVVDAQLRVHGLQGLRVVDASVMPSIVGANTNAPVIMLAEKSVDLLLAHGS